MKSATAKEYADSIKARKAAIARAETARVQLMMDVQDKIIAIIGDLKSKYPQLAYVPLTNLVDTSPNAARKRPKPEQGPVYIHFGVNPHYSLFNLEEENANEIKRSFYEFEAEVKNQIILQLEMQGEWKYVDGSMFFYNNGPQHYWSNWTMVPIS